MEHGNNRKRKTLAFQGKEPNQIKHTQITILERVSKFTYLGYKLSNQGEI